MASAEKSKSNVAHKEQEATDGKAKASTEESKSGTAGKTAKAKYKTQSLRGQVVWLGEVLRDRFGIETDPDAMQADVALETTDGQLYPIVKDFRGRGFHLDPQLRNVDIELVVRRYQGSPMVQVVRVYTIKPDGKYELDYWCDICAIPMYELKQCECCQGPIHIRERRVEESDK